MVDTILRCEGCFRCWTYGDDPQCDCDRPEEQFREVFRKVDAPANLGAIFGTRPAEHDASGE